VSLEVGHIDGPGSSRLFDRYASAKDREHPFFYLVYDFMDGGDLTNALQVVPPTGQDLSDRERVQVRLCLSCSVAQDIVKSALAVTPLLQRGQRRYLL
jgi:hypothetical protein